jgi:hypothetical protein
MKAIDEDRKVVKSWKLKVEREEKKKAEREKIKDIVDELRIEGMVREKKGRYFL